MTRRALALAVTALILTTAVAQAETVDGDGDALTSGVQGLVDLGTAQPGQDVRVDVLFVLTCTGTNHVDANQLVRLTPGAITVPPGGSFGVGSLLFAPDPGWPADGAECPTNLQPTTSGPLRVILTAPSEPGLDYRYSFTWNRGLMPATAADGAVFEGTAPTIAFILDVAENTPPTLELPADSTVEGNTTGGAIAAYVVSASDAEDADPPTPDCSPAVGDVLPLGTTTIECSVTDGGGLEDAGSFDITVVDTTAPSLAGHADVNVTTNDPGGSSVTFGKPAANDIVDPSPTVGCVPASGSTFPVGSTTVTCTATDASGNHASSSFKVNVTYVPLVTWTVVWGEPITTGETFVANPGRTVPIKVDVFANGVERTSGRVFLVVTPCAGGPAVNVAMSRDSGRWAGKLDTSLLAGPGCYVAAVTVDGAIAGSVRIDLRGSAAAESGTPRGKGKH